MIVQGGQGVMLRVMLDTTIQAVRDQWVASGRDRSVKDQEAHVTLVFVGRDLDEEVSKHVVQAAIEAFRVCPPGVRLTGEFAKFGRDRDHLVAKVTPSPALLQMREAALASLQSAGVKIRNDFSYNPHVTLAIGPGFEPASGDLSPRTLRVYSTYAKIGSEQRRELKLATKYACGCTVEEIERGRCGTYDEHANERAQPRPHA